MTDMQQHPWRQICDFLLESECGENPYDFCQQTLENIGRLIPYDAAGLFFVDPSGEQVEKMDSIGLDSQNTSDYLNYYRRFDCFKPQLWQSGTTGHIDWRQYRHTEFVTDFIARQKIRFTSGLLLFDPNHSRIAALTIHRTAGKDYHGQELQTMETIQPHLNNWFALIAKVESNKNRQPHYEEIIGNWIFLSKREAEVALLLCQRLTSCEIAAKMAISRRTVEFHINNIYLKLRVRNRKEFLKMISGNTKTLKNSLT